MSFSTALLGNNEEKSNDFVFQNKHVSIRKKDIPDLNEVQKELCCKLSKQAYNNPVVTGCCGNIFNKTDLSEWLQYHPEECPTCDKKCNHFSSVSLLNFTLKKLG